MSPRPRYREQPQPQEPRKKFKIRAAPPKFYTIPHNRVAEEGDTVRFQCSVAGHPDPWVAWDKDGMVVTPGGRITVSERDDIKYLEISDVIVEDSGIYRITLENASGRIEASARLDIISHRNITTRGLRARSASPRSGPTYRRYMSGEICIS